METKDMIPVADPNTADGSIQQQEAGVAVENADGAENLGAEEIEEKISGEGTAEEGPSPERQEKMNFVARLAAEIRQNEETRMEARYGAGRVGKVRRWFATTTSGKWTKVGLKVAGGSAAMLATTITGGGAALLLAPIVYSLGMKTAIDGAIEGAQEAWKGGRRRQALERSKGELCGALGEMHRRAREDGENFRADDIERAVRAVADREQAIINQENVGIKEERKEALIRTIASTVATVGVTFFTGVPVGFQDFDKVGSAAEYGKMGISGVDPGAHRVGISIGEMFSRNHEVSKNFFHFLYKATETPTANAASHIGGFFKTHVASIANLPQADALIKAAKTGVMLAYAGLLLKPGFDYWQSRQNIPNPENAPTVRVSNENPDSDIRKGIDGIRQREKGSDDGTPVPESEKGPKPSDDSGGGAEEEEERPTPPNSPDEGEGAEPVTPSDDKPIPGPEKPPVPPAPEPPPVAPSGPEDSVETNEQIAEREAEDIIKVLESIGEGSETLAQNIIAYGFKSSKNPDALKVVLKKEIDYYENLTTLGLLDVGMSDFVLKALKDYLSIGVVGENTGENTKETSQEKEAEVIESAERLLQVIDSLGETKFAASTRVTDVILEDAGENRVALEKLLKDEIDPNRDPAKPTKLNISPWARRLLTRHFEITP